MKNAAASRQPSRPQTVSTIVDLAPKRADAVRGGGIRPQDIPIVTTTTRPS